MVTCNRRLELRLPDKEKCELEALALSKGISISEATRRALRAYRGRMGALSRDDRSQVAELRRQLNELEALLGSACGCGHIESVRNIRDTARSLMKR
jgi:hypothetical protein